jgi:UDP-N-acetylglucosamine:LPS N-acetylglucosamine transferase
MPENVCIYFSDTGGGHRSAADAVEAAIRSLLDSRSEKPDVSIIKEAVAEKSHPVNRKFVEFYNYLLRHHQPLMKYYYWLLHAIRPETGLNLCLTEDYFCQLLSRHAPRVIVSVHPMINHGIAHAMNKLGLQGQVKLVVVVTDPNADLWRAWACQGADLVIVPNYIVANRLEEFGVDPERISVLGMPIHPNFVQPPVVPRRQFLGHLGLSAETLTVCINAGWAGGGNMLSIYRQLARVKRPLQALFLCGHNTDLYNQAMAAAAESDVPTAVLPFHDCMSDLMSAVDVMVTKAGGLTTYQAVARRLPLVFDVLTPPMPQERGTIDMLVDQKMASAIHRAEDIVELIDNFQPNPLRAQQQLPSAYDLNLTDVAPFDIAACVLELCSPPVVLRQPEPTEDAICDWQPRSLARKTAGGQI